MIVKTPINIDDNKNDIYIGLPDQAHIKITEDFIVMMGTTYDKIKDDRKEIAALLLATSMMIVRSIIKDEEIK